MTQKVLPIKSQRRGKRVLSGAAGVVALECNNGQEFTLRFLTTAAEWGESVREVRLDLELAQKLQRLLNDELEDLMYGREYN